MGGTSTGSVRKRATALVGALALSVAGVLVSASSAWADPAAGDMPTTAGSIVIHKGQQQSTSGTSGSASGTAPSNFAPLSGVIFTAYPISSIDLTTNAGWTTLSAINATTVSNDACAAAANGTSVTIGTTSITFDTANKIVSSATDTSGVTTITAGPTKAYLVCETDNSAAEDSAGNPVHVVAPAQPFIVSIPFPDNNGTNKWLTDVNVYPKNGVATINKQTVAQPDNQVAIGSVAKFTVTTLVPDLPANTTFSYYIVHDAMDSTGFKDTGVDSVTLDGTALVAGTDYTVTNSGTPNTIVDVSFTQSGLQKLALAGGKNVVTTFKGTVIRAGAINNTAVLYTKTQTGTEPPTNPPTTPTNPPTNPPTSPEVTTNWGPLQIKKTDAANGNALSGATFNIYNATADTRYGDDCTKAVATGPALTGAPLGLDAQAGPDLVTDSNGQITVPALYVNSTNDNPTAAHRCYVVVETKAPTGYVIPANGSTKGVAVVTSSTNPVTVTFQDPKQLVPGLPLTGGDGEVALTAGGAGLVVVAAAVAFVARRRKQNA